MNQMMSLLSWPLMVPVEEMGNRGLGKYGVVFSSGTEDLNTKGLVPLSSP
jgi:hypothetical protein